MSKKINLKDYIRNIEDFPEKGIQFKDISPLLFNGEALNYVVEKMAELSKDADIILGPDARGFLFGAPTAAMLSKPYVMVRKPGKLPGEVIKEKYDYEYNKGKTLEMQVNLIKKGDKVVIIDDVLATGGTTKAIIDLVERQGGIITKVIFLLKLKSFGKNDNFKKYEIISLIEV